MPKPPLTQHAAPWRPALAAACLLAALLAAPIAQAAEQASAKLNINLRAAPNLESPIVGVLKPGVVVEVLSSHGEFVRVRRADGVQGHLKRKHLSTAPALAPALRPAANAAAPAAAPVQALPAPVAQAPVGVAPPPVPPAAVLPVSPRAVASPWYVRVSAGVGFATRTPEAIERALDTAGGNASLRQLDTAVPAFGVEVGYAFTPQLALELGLQQLGEYRGRVQAVGADAARLQTVLNESIPRGGWGAEALAVVQQPLGALRLGAGAGVFCGFEESPLQTNVAGVVLNSRPCAPLFNLRVGRVLTPHWTIDLSTQAVFFESRVMTVGLGLSYRP